MFDNQTSNPTNSLNTGDTQPETFSSQFGPRPPQLRPVGSGGPVATTPTAPRLDTPQSPQVDDIFSKTDNKMAPTPLRPTQPGQASQMPISAPPTPSGRMRGNRSMWSNKLLIIALVIIIVTVVIGGGWLVYGLVKSLTGDNGTNSNTNINTNTNTNTNTQANINTNTNINVNTNTNFNNNSNVPSIIDTDSDGLTDDEEKQLGTDKQKYDTDGDGLNDYAEVRLYLTDPNNSDTDGDGYGDGKEVVNGYDPKIPGSARLFDIP
ncbi:MAG TPA: hypothetical protein VJB67_03625 [Patescibacteria group bacterium]|nr:hypothetical protein [Patescibacteria group bacterium]